jgi:hypothetical protein
VDLSRVIFPESCPPKVSPIGPQTVRRLESELDFRVDKRRFRANIYLDLARGEEFAGDDLATSPPEDRRKGRDNGFGTRPALQNNFARSRNGPA